MEEGARKSGLISRYKRSSLLKNNIFSLENFENVPNKKTNLKSNSIGIKIFLIKNKINNKNYVKKEIDLKIIPNYSNLIKKNIIFYKKNFLKSNNCILNLYNSHKTKDKKIILIYDFIKEGNLKDFLIKNSPFSEENVFLIFYQILITVKYFHNKGIFFNNLNIDNILLGENFRIYLYNFYEYVNANEIGDNFNLFYSNNEDLFSLGIILYNLSHNLNNDDNNNNFVPDDLKKLINNLIFNEINNIDEIFNQKWMKKFMENPNQIIISRFRDFTKEKSLKYNNNNKNDDENEFYLNKNNSFINHLQTESSTNEFDYDSILYQNNDNFIYDKNNNNNDYDKNVKKIKNKIKSNNNINKVKKMKRSFLENDEYKKSIFLQRVESEKNLFNNDKQNFFIDSLADEENNFIKRKKNNIKEKKGFWDKFSDFFIGEMCICQTEK